MPATTFSQMEADRAFAAVERAARRSALSCRLRRRRGGCGALRVLEPVRSGSTPGRAEVPLDAIRGTLEPHRSAQFDHAFRPSHSARSRWQRVWLAEERGAVLPPVSLTRVRDGYAVRDGHHRVSVARARGALMIDAVVDA